MSDAFDHSAMRRAIELAMRGRGRVEPNPMVGCIITRDETILAEGWHHAFGEPHAEADALARCAASGISTSDATAYVTLEPCCHIHKKTPPCVPRLIEANIARVVVGTTDPNPEVAGRGLEQLRRAGIVVDHSYLEASCRQLIAPFIARMVHHRPYVTLKWARTADGQVAGPGGRRLQISNAASMRQVHGLRARSDAILIGIHTALNDDPLLTARHVPEARRLIRVVLDTHLRLNPHSQLAATAKIVPTWVYCSPESAHSERAEGLSQAGVVLKPIEDLHHNLIRVLHDLGEADVTHLLVEPGPTLAESFLRQNLADRAWVFHSPNISREPSPFLAPTMPWPMTTEVNLDGDRLREHLNPQSHVYFHMEPSADMPQP